MWVSVSITPEANYGAVAEHAVGLMIACAHRFLPLHAAGAKGDWAIRNTLATNTLFGKTVGILGLGRIGRKVAMICEKGLDMKVLGYDPMVSAVPGLDTLEMAGSIQEIFTRADVVSLHMPYTPDSHGLVNRDVLRGMKDSAILINTARGSLVDENALYEALRDGEIAGAGLDVRMTEPPVGISPLFDCANCIITPHSSALGEEVKDLMGLHAAQEVHRVLSGEKPIWARNTF